MTTAAILPTTESVTTAAQIEPSTVNLVQQTTSATNAGVTTRANQPTTESLQTTATPSEAPMITTLRQAVSSAGTTQSSGIHAPCTMASINACNRFQPQLPIVSYDPVSYSNFCRWVKDQSSMLWIETISNKQPWWCVISHYRNRYLRVDGIIVTVSLKESYVHWLSCPQKGLH